MSKRKTEEPGDVRCADIYEFSKKLHEEVLTLDNLIGCKPITTVLENEIGAFLLHKDWFELTRLGTLPVNRFFRFYGVEHSSKRTAVLAFAKQHKLNVIVIRTLIGFSPKHHLSKIYEKIANLDKPAFVVFSGVEHVFMHDQSSILALRDCLRKVDESHYPLWTIMCTTTKAPLPPEIGHYFADNTRWAGMTIPEIDIFSHLERLKIFVSCIRSMCPTPDAFPWTETHELTDFIEKYSKYCTFAQIRQFVRRVFKRKQHELNEELLQGQSISKDKFMPTKDHFFRSLFQLPDGATINIVAPWIDNIDPYWKV